MTTYTTTADANGDFSVNFGKAYNGGESITVRSTKMGQSKEILLNAPIGEYEPLPPIVNTGSIRFTGNVVNFPNNMGGVIIEMQGAIGEFAFYGYADSFFQKATSLEILNGVSSIRRYAFTSWKNITSLTLPDTLLSIDVESFSDCVNLVYLNIGSGLTSTGSSCFSGCTAIQEIVCKATNPPSIGNQAFLNVPSSATVKVPQQSVDLYRSSSWGQVFTNIVAI